LARLPVKSSELVSVFTEANRNIKSIFLNYDAKKLKIINAYTESTDLILGPAKKLFIS
jgi:hypothetical protein